MNLKALGKNNNGEQKIPLVPYKNCYAKTNEDGTPGLTVYEHSKIVGQIAGNLFNRLYGCIQSLIPIGFDSLAAMHDLGKVSPGFQRKYFMEYLRENYPDLANHPGGFEENHATISEVAINSILDKKFSKFATIVGAHHGYRYRNIFFENEEKYGGKRWAEERKKLFEKLKKEFGDLPKVKINTLQSHLLAAIICMADWVGSDVEYFNPSTIKENSLVNISENVLDKIGFQLPQLKKNLCFKEIFGFSPNKMQQKFIGTPLEPGIYILEGATGMGKTEAALFKAYQHMTNNINSGIYFGLPTRVTSNLIYKRIQKFLEKVCIKYYPLKLIHGHSWLESGGGSELAIGKSWFDSKKRALLAPFGVGTIDQSLLSVMRVKHFFLRLLGLSGKIVILDEVHSYDVYTGTLLNHLIRTLKNINCTIIILSATLTAERKNELLFNTIDSNSQNYPLITWQTSKKSLMVPIQSKSGIPVKILFHKSKIKDLAKMAVKKAREGNCVLWIANTIARAQRYFKALSAEMKEGEFEIGLLHSNFPLYLRQELEKKWIGKLGVKGNRPKGCILVSTQVVEQSVDIDSDFLITDIAPSDMIIQRIGRLWRHSRDYRPCPEPTAIIISEDITNIEDEKDFKECIGKDICRVYSPYVLWKTFQAWKNRKYFTLKKDIREILEKTYKNDDSEPQYVKKMYNDLKKKSKELKQRAASTKSNESYLYDLNDDEYNVATRYNSYPRIDCLIVENFIEEKYQSIFKLLNGIEIKLKNREKNLFAIKEIYKNIVSLPKFYFKEFTLTKPICLKEYFYNCLIILKLQADGSLFYYGQDTSLFFTEDLGVLKKQEEDINNISLQEEEYYEFDW